MQADDFMSEGKDFIISSGAEDPGIHINPAVRAAAGVPSHDPAGTNRHGARLAAQNSHSAFFKGK
jgi:hypothetical protein